MQVIPPQIPIKALIPASAHVVARMNDFNSAYCVYEHWGYLERNDTEEQCLYIGVCSLREVFLFPDARMNSEWKKRFTSEESLTIKIIGISRDIKDCANFRFQQVRDRRPYCNVHGTIPQMNMKVICNETGEVFDTAAETAKAHNISSSALSNHLRNMPGYRSVKGKTYRRGELP